MLHHISLCRTRIGVTEVNMLGSCWNLFPDAAVKWRFKQCLQKLYIHYACHGHGFSLSQRKSKRSVRGYSFLKATKQSMVIWGCLKVWHSCSTTFQMSSTPTRPAVEEWISLLCASFLSVVIISSHQCASEDCWGRFEAGKMWMQIDTHCTHRKCRHSCSHSPPAHTRTLMLTPWCLIWRCIESYFHWKTMKRHWNKNIKTVKV